MNGFNAEKEPESYFFFPCKVSHAVVFIFSLILIVNGCSEKEQKQSRPDVPVKTATVIQKDVPMEVSANGTVEAFSVVNITSRVDGQVTQIHFKEGQEVEKDQLLFSIDDRSYQAMLQAAQANLARDRIRLEKAKKDAVRYADLVKKDYVTKDQYEQALADSESLEAIVKGDEASLENATINVAYCRIVAPIAGRVGSILINEGNIIKANDSKPLTVIHQLRPVYVKFSVPERRLPEIQQRITTHELKVVAGAPGKKDETREGQLTFLDNAINPNTGTIDLKAVFENTDKSLWPGQFVNVLLILGMRPQAIVVPSEAVQMGQQSSYVFVVKDDLTVESKDVTTGPQMNHETVIESGLAAGERVVTDGQLRLFPGAKVALKDDTQAAGASHK